MLFAYRLAAKLGSPSVGRLVDSLTKDEWLGWQGVAIIDGWYHGWSQTGELIAQLNNQTNRLEAMQAADPQEATKKQTWLSGYDVVKRLTNFGKQAPEAKGQVLDVPQLMAKLKAMDKMKHG